MKFLQFALLFTFVMLVAHLPTALSYLSRRAAPDTCKEEPDDCPAGWVCMPQEDGHLKCIGTLQNF